MSETDIIGYSAVTEGDTSPLFCTDCVEDVNRTVEPRTEDDLENFDTASCALCERTFYTGGGNDGFEILEDLVLISSATNDGIYKASRYQQLDYEHLRESAIKELESIRKMADESLERVKDN